jgi:hypothetical protein
VSSSDETVEIPPDGFLRKTGQVWKLVVGGLVLPIPMALLAYWNLRRIRPDQPPGEMVLSMGVLVIGTLLMTALLASVRCPRCRVRLIRQVFRASPGTQAMVGFLKLYSCPACGFEPRREANGPNQAG